MGIGFLELVVIGIAALVLLGPQRLPEIMRHIARFYVQMRRTSNDFKSAFDHVVREAEADLKKEDLFRIESNARTVSSSQSPGAETPTEEPTTPAKPQSQATETPALRPEKPFGWSSPEELKPMDSKDER